MSDYELYQTKRGRVVLGAITYVIHAIMIAFVVWLSPWSFQNVALFYLIMLVSDAAIARRAAHGI